MSQPKRFGKSHRGRSPHIQRYHRAARRAFMGANLHLGVPVAPLTLNEAAAAVASTPQYVAAATIVLQGDDPNLITRVLRGDVSLPNAANQVRARVKLIAAFQNASPDDRIALGKAVGVDRVFDDSIAPLL
jgi:hypothetical protein